MLCNLILLVAVQGGDKAKDGVLLFWGKPVENVENSVENPRETVCLRDEKQTFLSQKGEERAPFVILS